MGLTRSGGRARVGVSGECASRKGGLLLRVDALHVVYVELHLNPTGDKLGFVGP